MTKGEQMRTSKMQNTKPNDRQSTSGFSLLELLIVVAITAVMTAVAIPQMIAQRRLTRSTAVTRQIATQIRYARQLSMSQRDAITFQYDDTNKQIKIIDHNNNQPTNVACNLTGTAVLTAVNYPMTACAVVATTIPLATDGLISSELSYGIPTTPVLPTAALGDGISKTNLIGANLNITFQPDGRVLDSSGNPANTAMYIYNTVQPQATASAISIVGGSGRVKIWRYSSSANVYAE